MPGIIVVGADDGSLGTFLDTLAYYLSTPPIADPRFSGQPDTTVVNWVLGDIGMGGPLPLPVGYISPFNDNILPYGAGESTGGPHGVDMDLFIVPIVVVFAEHNPVPPIPTPITVGGQPAPYEEHPGYRSLLTLSQQIRGALRVEPTFGGAVATSTITEMKPGLIDLDDKVYRGQRHVVTARARRGRG